ncbi:hypothetical protein FA95DRAFT_1557676 [Auriscalpium vulgare]|uniref:Uncharacterized protein n=1 Tax=Auriscalpium vulgare TaxID=40419 RepID=A0ACB8RX12_9AGAM|nr:hypothetical protein FA95DRAFT_1557676 [Auriscalpium vulgare]
MSLLGAPSELLFHIFAFLEVPDIVSLRQTCKELATLSHDRGVWLDQLHRQQTFLPLPVHTIPLAGLTTPELEHLSVSAFRSHRDWPRDRHTARRLGSTSITPGEYQDIVYLTLMLDRLVLCVYSHGAIVLWDVAEKLGEGRRVVPSLAYWELWGREPWTSAVAVADAENGAIYVTITRAQNRTQQGSATVLMRIPTAELLLNPSLTIGGISPPKGTPKRSPSRDNHPFYDIDTFFGPDAQFVRTIEPTQKLLALSRTPFIDIIHWPSNTGVTIDAQREDLDQLWNGIIGLQFVGPYLLCIKARTVELYAVQHPFPAGLHTYFVSSSLGPPHASSTPPTRPLTTALRPAATHCFPRTNFRGVSVSAPLPGTCHTTLAFLAHDVLRGVFHYRVHIAAEGEQPLLRVELVGLHNMASGVPGFVSAAALGPLGTRGVWVERAKNVTARRVMVFSSPVGEDGDPVAPETDSETQLAQRFESSLQVHDADDEDDEDEDEDVDVDDGQWGLGRPIDAHAVYEVRSYDLREDLIHVAFSEVSGRIALGTRSGDIRVI